MDITPLVPRSRQMIQRYGAGGFTLNGEHYPHSVIVCEDRVMKWDVREGEDITPNLLNISQLKGIELLLIGTGNVISVLPSDLRDYFRACGVAVEAMDTGAACRTYNILASEDRHVAAALIAI